MIWGVVHGWLATIGQNGQQLIIGGVLFLMGCGILCYGWLRRPRLKTEARPSCTFQRRGSAQIEEDGTRLDRMRAINAKADEAIKSGEDQIRALKKRVTKEGSIEDLIQRGEVIEARFGSTMRGPQEAATRWLAEIRDADLFQQSELEKQIEVDDINEGCVDLRLLVYKRLKALVALRDGKKTSANAKLLDASEQGDKDRADILRRCSEAIRAGETPLRALQIARADELSTNDDLVRLCDDLVRLGFEHPFAFLQGETLQPFWLEFLKQARLRGFVLGTYPRQEFDAMSEIFFPPKPPS